MSEVDTCEWCGRPATQVSTTPLTWRLSDNPDRHYWCDEHAPPEARSIA